MTVEFDTSELDELAAELATAPARAEGASSAHMTRIAALFRDDAKAAAPVDTRELQDSIVVRGGGQGSRLIIATADHAVHVEFGTSDTAPQPFMWPQVPAAAERLQQAMQGIDPFDHTT